MSMYIMKKLNREKRAMTEEQKKELEEKGYQCIQMIEDSVEEAAPAMEEKAEKVPEKKKPVKKGDKTASEMPEQDPAGDGSENDGDTGKD